jgi:hypothetical protein
VVSLSRVISRQQEIATKYRKPETSANKKWQVNGCIEDGTLQFCEGNKDEGSHGFIKHRQFIRCTFKTFPEFAGKIYMF